MYKCCFADRGSKLEKARGMDKGYLGDNPYVVRVDNIKWVII